MKGHAEADRESGDIVRPRPQFHSPKSPFQTSLRGGNSLVEELEPKSGRSTLGGRMVRVPRSAGPAHLLRRSRRSGAGLTMPYAVKHEEFRLELLNHGGSVVGPGPANLTWRLLLNHREGCTE